MSKISPKSSDRIREISPVGGENLSSEGFVEEIGFSLEWKSERVMEDESCDNEDDKRAA